MPPARRQDAVRPSPTRGAPRTVSESGRPRRWAVRIVLGALIVSGGIALAVRAVDRQSAPQVYGYEIVNTYPHDPRAYSQGLVFHEGFLYEGTGKYGDSTVRKVELETGRVVKQTRLARRYFGEGITRWGNQIVQLTWKEHVAFVYDKETLRRTGSFRYTGEGWGLTHDGRHLIMSDGTPVLRFIDPQTLRVVRRLTVRHQGQRVQKLNELEFVEGEILANVWYKDYVLRISPSSGEVTGWIDLRGLDVGQRARDEVLNGIAFDEATGRLFVTGKNWPKLFEIKLVPR